MQKLTYTTFINAPREKVWDVMLADATYRDWTNVFSPGSYYQGEWKEGSKMLFLGPNSEDGGEMGMVSTIKAVRPHEFVSIEHIGSYQNGVEDTTSEQAKEWSGAFENYTFIEKDGGTELTVDLNVPEEYADMFNDMWPKGLARLKELAEAA